MGNILPKPKPPTDIHEKAAREWNLRSQISRRWWPFNIGCGISESGSNFESMITSSSMTSTSSSSFQLEQSEDEIASLDEICMTGFKVKEKYEILKILGGGTFGKVLKARDLTDNTLVALKVTKDCGKVAIADGEAEYMFGKMLNDSDPKDSSHIVRLFEGFRWRNRYFIAFELMNLNLKDYVEERVGNGRNGLPLYETAYISHQVVQTLQHLHKLKIMHCDLKPENIMVKSEFTLQIKVIDFGAAAYVHLPQGTYIQTRHYRAPEVILGLGYGASVDMWSLGCLIAYMHTGYTLFPGSDEPDQLYKIMQVLGLPPTKFLLHAKKTLEFFHRSYTPEGVFFTPIYRPDPPEMCFPPGSFRLFDVLFCGRRNLQEIGENPMISAKEKILLNLIIKLLDFNPYNRPEPNAVIKNKLFKAVEKVDMKEMRNK